MIDIPTFPNIKPNKELFLKLLEETAEVYSAFEDYKEEDFDFKGCEERILNETADVMQVCSNIFAAFHQKPNPFIIEMMERNYARGRYDREKVNEGWV